MEKDKGKTKEGGQGKGHSIEGTLPLLLHFPRPLPSLPVTVTICSTFQSRRKYSTACVTRSSLNTRALSLVLPHHQHLFDGSFLVLSHSSSRWPRAPKEANSTRPRGLRFRAAFSLLSGVCTFVAGPRARRSILRPPLLSLPRWSSSPFARSSSPAYTLPACHRISYVLGSHFGTIFCGLISSDS